MAGDPIARAGAYTFSPCLSQRLTMREASELATDVKAIIEARELKIFMRRGNNS